MTRWGSAGFGADSDRPGYGETGRYLVLLDPYALEEGVAALRDRAGLTLANTADSDSGALGPEELQGADGVLFDRLGVAVVEIEPDRLPALTSAATDQRPLVVERERAVRAIGDGGPGLTATWPGAGLSAEYLRGYRDAVQHLLTSAGATAVGGVGAGAAPEWDESEATWGLQATDTLRSPLTGAGVKVAVLDTGFDLAHPDFAGRAVVGQRFVDGEGVQDGHGHGTHCIGTACGPARPGVLPRYGVAGGAEIFAGKVLDDRGSGVDGGILAGMNWAVTNECRVVSMSLGAPTQPGQTYSTVFEQVASRALAQGTLMVAAAGNESERDMGVVSPVGHPANCPSILAVAALDPALQVAVFSNRGINPNGGQVDIAAPGVDVRSSWPMPTRYQTISGTSMATPHVAGVTALLAQAHPDAPAADLHRMLVAGARRLPSPSADVGAGLLQAP
jgi:subtilisin family serine protease